MHILRSSDQPRAFFERAIWREWQPERLEIVWDLGASDAFGDQHRQLLGLLDF
jgi:hypothetical protein